jgi:hypothetical protein
MFRLLLSNCSIPRPSTDIFESPESPHTLPNESRHEGSKCSQMPNLYDLLFNGVISVTNAALQGKTL